MRIFVTGASGWLGSALVSDLLEAGHQVVGLARSEQSAQALRARGVEVQPGSLDDLDALRTATAASDGVAHLAFMHDIAFSSPQGAMEAAQADRRAVELFGEVLRGSDRPLVIASGLLGLKPGQIATEHDFPEPATNPLAGGRALTTRVTLDLAPQGVRSSVVRLAPTNHGEGDKGFVASMIALAREKGVSGYISDGLQRWPAAHRLDASKLFALALEKAPAGSVLHAAAEEAVTIKEIAETIGKQLGLPTQSIAPEEAMQHFGWLAMPLSSDAPASSLVTRDLLGWQPTQPGLITDLEQGHYFQ